MNRRSLCIIIFWPSMFRLQIAHCKFSNFVQSTFVIHFPQFFFCIVDLLVFLNHWSTIKCGFSNIHFSWQKSFTTIDLLKIGFHVFFYWFGSSNSYYRPVMLVSWMISIQNFAGSLHTIDLQSNAYLHYMKHWEESLYVRNWKYIDGLYGFCKEWMTQKARFRKGIVKELG